jgi:hypothetical protein
MARRRNVFVTRLLASKDPQQLKILIDHSLHIVYCHTSHDYSEAKDFISGSLSCSVWRIVSQSKDLQLGSHVTNSQKSIQILTDFNSTKFDLIRILSFARFQPKLSSYSSGWCGRKSITKLSIKNSIGTLISGASLKKRYMGLWKSLKYALVEFDDTFIIFPKTLPNKS